MVTKITFGCSEYPIFIVKLNTVMKKSLIILASFLAGAMATLLLAFLLAPSLFLLEDKSNYDFTTTVTKLENSIAENGWKLAHVNDLQATMAKFDKEVRQVKVLEICNPDHAYSILSAGDERVVSSLMPCRVAVYECPNGDVRISRLNSSLMSKPMSKLIRSTMTVAAKDTEAILETAFN